MGLIDAIGGSLISGGSGILGSIIGSISNAATNRANIQNAWKMAQWNYEKNLEQWNRENAYNSPEQQMERLRAAGLNPNLVYGNGSAVQTAAHSPQMNAQAPSLQPYTNWNLGGADAVAAYNQSRQIDSLADLQKSQSELAKSQAAAQNVLATKYAAEIEGLGLGNTEKRLYLTYADEFLKTQLANSKKDIEVKDQNIAESKQRVDESASRIGLNSFQCAQINVEIDRIASITALTYSQKEGQDLKNKFDRETLSYRKKEIQSKASEATSKALTAYQEYSNLGTDIASKRIAVIKAASDLQKSLAGLDIAQGQAGSLLNAFVWHVGGVAGLPQSEINGILNQNGFK